MADCALAALLVYNVLVDQSIQTGQARRLDAGQREAGAQPWQILFIS
jgi:hypothetical protein